MSGSDFGGKAKDSGFDAVLFDMDGVLVDSEELIARSAMEMFRVSYGFQMPREAFYPYVGAGEDRFLGDTAAAHGIAIDIVKAKAKTYEIYARMASDYLKVLPGVSGYLAGCRRLGLKLALASAADLAKVDINLAILGLEERTFDVLVTGSDVERKKPHPDIYLLAAERLGVDIGRCLVIEDAVNGIIAGMAAGARCLGLTTSFSEESLRKAGALWCAADLSVAPLPDQLRNS
jgi:HAD superfamily hydrolase (TIGR01509 family)